MHSYRLVPLLWPYRAPKRYLSNHRHSILRAGKYTLIGLGGIALIALALGLVYLSILLIKILISFIASWSPSSWRIIAFSSSALIAVFSSGMALYKFPRLRRTLINAPTKALSYPLKGLLRGFVYFLMPVVSIVQHAGNGIVAVTFKSKRGLSLFGEFCWFIGRPFVRLFAWMVIGFGSVCAWLVMRIFFKPVAKVGQAAGKVPVSSLQILKWGYKAVKSNTCPRIVVRDE